MNFFQEYAILIVPILAGLITQAIKLATDQIKGNFNWHELLASYGGMPSAHTAFVVSLTAILGLTEGINTAIFAVSFILMAIVIRDAMGFRLILGQQSKVLNHLVDKLPEPERKQLPRLRERLGHTFLQVTTGGALGIITSFLYHWLVMPGT
ncbi:MAG: divergent PAP2 family protein [Patescibacteria group bacterium]